MSFVKVSGLDCEVVFNIKAFASGIIVESYHAKIIFEYLLRYYWYILK